jgi:hypothetical protein
MRAPTLARNNRARRLRPVHGLDAIERLAQLALGERDMLAILSDSVGAMLLDLY